MKAVKRGVQRFFMVVLAACVIACLPAASSGCGDGGRKAGVSALCDAAGENADVGKVRALLKKNPGLINARDEDGYTPLHHAAAYNHKEAAELLISQHAEINVQGADGLTPLHFAAGRGYAGITDILLSGGADPGIKSAKGKTPEELAAGLGCAQVIEVFRSHEGKKHSGSKAHGNESGK
ncbi:MAG: ankyrin repeat domain-containing protein [Candidatus Eremiobacteraeota bacterium]|nr:ankyrin repeat domain-containing protein [Candidatus Eremiobacteraeota bacterium]